MRLALPLLLVTGCVTSDVETASLDDLENLRLTVGASHERITVEMTHDNVRPCPELASSVTATVNDLPLPFVDRGHYEEEGCSNPRLQLDNPGELATAKIVIADGVRSIQVPLGDSLVKRVATRIDAADWKLTRGSSFTFAWSPATDIQEQTPPRVWIVSPNGEKLLLEATFRGDEVTAAVPANATLGAARLEIYMYGVAIEPVACSGATCQLAHSQHAFEDVTVQ